MLYELWAGGRLTLEKAVPMCRRARRTIAASAVLGSKHIKKKKGGALGDILVLCCRLFRTSLGALAGSCPAELVIITVG